ncbi:MAG: ABC transporter permease subunit [Mobilitalea sp.]
MNIYLHELKTYRMTTIIWIFSLCGILLLMMCFYPIIKNDMDTFSELMNNFPPAMKAIMGVVFEDFSSPLGFHGFVFTYSSLLGAIQAMNLGVGIVSKEERERTADFLMTKPVSRIQIITAKLMSVLTILIITNIAYFITVLSIVTGLSEEKTDMTRLILMCLSLFFMQIMFFSIGLVASIFMKKVRAVLPISLGLVFMFFAISAFAVTSNEDKLRYATPFQYFTTKHIMNEGTMELSFLIIGAGIVIISTALSYYRYCRKSIPAV